MKVLSGRIALVTGASSGIGRALAVELANQGATLCLVGRRLDALKITAQMLGPEAVAHCYKVDLTCQEDIQELADRLKSEFPGLDYLINSAGVIALNSFERARVEDFDRQYATNVRGCFFLTQALLPLLRPSRGQILLINSSAGIRAAGGEAGQYSVTKYALHGFADNLRQEVNDWGIRVQSVFIGRTATPMQEAIHEIEGKSYHPEELLQPDEVARLLVNIIGLVQSAEVTDITIRPMMNPRHPATEESETVLLRAVDGTIFFWNQGAERMYGWRSDESVGKCSHRLLMTRFPKPLALIQEELFEKGVWEGRLLHTRRDGTKLAVASRWELQRSSSDGMPKVLERNVSIFRLAISGFSALITEMMGAVSSFSRLITEMASPLL